MRNIVRSSLMIYEADILHLGGKVQYFGEGLKCGRNAVIRNARVYLEGLVYYVEMKCLSDGTAVVVFVHDDRAKELRELFEELSQGDGDGEFDAYMFLRGLKQFWLFITQFICSCVSLWAGFNTVKHASISYALIACITLVATCLLGLLYSKIRCYSFEQHLEQVEMDKLKL